MHATRRTAAVLSCLATCVLVSLIVAVLYNYTTRPLYQATAQILIDRESQNAMPNAKEVLQLPTEYFATEYQLLAGRALEERREDVLERHRE